MCPVLFSFNIGDIPINIYGYGTMIAIGVIGAFWLSSHLAKKNGYDPDLFFYGGIIGLIFGLIGAKVLYWIVEFDRVIEDPSMLLSLDGGFVVYGGVIAGILTPIFYVKKIRKEPFLDKADIAFPCIALAQGFGRIGCFLAGCCYGAEAPEGAWYAVTFPEGSSAPAGIPLYPTQLVSAIGMLLLAGILLFIYKKSKFRGETVCAYMAFYSVGRYLIEMIRNDDRGVVGPFSTSQLISIVIFLLAIVLFIIFYKKNLAPSSQMTPEEKWPKKFADKKAAEAASKEEVAPESETAATAESNEATAEEKETESKETAEVLESNEATAENQESEKAAEEEAKEESEESEEIVAELKE